MGLGKTLSVLALICSSLDLDSTTMNQNQKTKHWGTLIVAPKSSEFDAKRHDTYGSLIIRQAIHSWMAQVSEYALL
jgi:hypothetical protein